MGLIVHRQWSRWWMKLGGWEKVPRAGILLYRFCATALTFYFVCVCWIFFRSLELHKALVVMHHFVLLQRGGPKTLDLRLWWLLGGLALMHWLNYKRVFANWWRRLPQPIFAAAYGAGWAVVVLFIPAQYVPFIYFQF